MTGVITWLASWAGWIKFYTVIGYQSRQDGAILPACDYVLHVCPARSSLKTMLLTQHVQSRWLDICLVLFFLWTSAILTSHLVNDPYLLVMTASLFFYVIFISTSCGWTLLWWPFIDLIFPDNFKEKRYPPGNSVSKGSWLEWSHGSCKENICGEWQL